MQGCGNIGQITCQEMYALRSYANAKPIASIPEWFLWIVAFFILLYASYCVYALIEGVISIGKIKKSQRKSL